MRHSGSLSLPRRVRTLVRRPLSVWLGQAVALGCVAGAVLLRLALTPLVDDGLPFVTFLPAALITSIWGGALAGLSALMLSSFIGGYLWLSPMTGFAFSASSWARMIAFWFLCGLFILIAALFRALIESEERANLLAGEMQHRVRNVLTLVKVISHQTSRNAPTLAEHQASFEARITSLAEVQEFVAGDPKSSLELRALLDRVLVPFDIARFSLSVRGPGFCRISVRPWRCSFTNSGRMPPNMALSPSPRGASQSAGHAKKAASGSTGAR